MLPRLVLVSLLLTLLGCGSSAGLEELGFEESVESGLAGRLTWRREVPPPAIPDRIPKACGGRPDVALVDLGPDGGLAGALVRVPAAPAQLPEEVALRAERCAVSPTIAVAAVGARLEVSSGDQLVHTFHLREVVGEQEQNIQVLAVPPDTGPLHWDLDREGLVHVTSDHFEWMHAWIHVGAPGAWTLTDAAGRFTLPELAPGIWDVQIWHPQLGLDEQTVTVPRNGPAALARVYE